MKLHRIVPLILMSSFFVQCGSASESNISEYRKASAPLYRFWRGFEKPGVENFHQILGDRFIPAAPETHAKNGLEAYLVVTPKEDHSDVIPDEYALVVYESQEAYQKAKATPEGVAYADMHWEIFEKETSASLVPINYSALSHKRIELNKAYDILALPVDWQRGYSTFYVGIKRPHISPGQFSDRLTNHVADVISAFSSQGLNAYVMMASDRYEIAYQNWTSKDAFEKAMRKNGGPIATDASEFMDLDMFLGARDFDNSIGHHDFVNVKFVRP